MLEQLPHQQHRCPIQANCVYCRTSVPPHPCRVNGGVGVAAGAYKWDGKPTTACNAAPGAAVSPAGAVSDGPETPSPLRDYRARRPAHTGCQVHMQVTVNKTGTWRSVLLFLVKARI